MRRRRVESTNPLYFFSLQRSAKEIRRRILGGPPTQQTDRLVSSFSGRSVKFWQDVDGFFYSESLVGWYNECWAATQSV